MWPTMLLNDHRRRLAQRSPQIFRRALPGIGAVIAEAILQGYHPVDPDFEELVVAIESRERSDTASANLLEEETDTSHAVLEGRSTITSICHLCVLQNNCYTSVFVHSFYDDFKVAV